MRRLAVVFSMVAIGLILLVGTGATQDAKKEQPKKAKGMLPAGFKSLGLSKEQVGKIYSIQSDYKSKIADLDKQIKELRTKESQDVFKVLTDDQREKYLKAKGVDTKPEKK